jgi:hypothetical protein
MAEREYTQPVQGKRYPLKTDAERAASRSNGGGNERPINVSLPQTPRTSDASRQVLLALSIAFVVFMASGGKVEQVIAKARGLPVPQNQPFTANTIFAWGFLFVGLMIVADTPAGDLAKAMAWLILLTVLLEFGPNAIANLTALTGGGTSSTKGPNLSKVPRSTAIPKIGFDNETEIR